MNKTAIKNFAIWARNKLIADVSYDARLIGITEDGIAKPLPQSFGGTLLIPERIKSGLSSLSQCSSPNLQQSAVVPLQERTEIWSP